MNAKEAQAKIQAAITGDARRVINRAAAFRPEIAAQVRELEGQFPMDNQAIGLCASILKMALRGKTNEETAERMISFAESL